MRSSKFVNKAVLLFCMLISSALDAVDFNKDGIDDLVFKSDDGYLKTWELDTS